MNRKPTHKITVSSCYSQNLLHYPQSLANRLQIHPEANSTPSIFIQLLLCARKVLLCKHLLYTSREEGIYYNLRECIALDVTPDRKYFSFRVINNKPWNLYRGSILTQHMCLRGCFACFSFVFTIISKNRTAWWRIFQYGFLLIWYTYIFLNSLCKS